jgi:radical SAM superfamily enzyme with C-terminal helix-hairpin-helix motif
MASAMAVRARRSGGRSKMSKKTQDIVILDCYTDEPSGYGVRPYLGTHQLHLSQALASLGLDHFYLTIDDLRYCSRGMIENDGNTDLSTLNRTENCDNALSILHHAKLIYIIMGCFVRYSYFSAVPPISDELYTYLKDTAATKILFYVLGTADGLAPRYRNSRLACLMDRGEYGSTYRAVVGNDSPTASRVLTSPDYDLLDRISSFTPPIISQLRYPIIAEIETGSGCETASCTFCIECVRGLKPVYRVPSSIIKQVRTLYDAGVRHFRLGRQPNFYHYYYQDVYQMETLLSGIRETCPEIETLHIDNANVLSVITQKGVEITKLIVQYCSSGNIAPLGVESFDMKVRNAIHKPGLPKQVLNAIETINNYGQARGADGFPVLLPGINLIYGLPQQTHTTHEINCEYLNRILASGWQTRRLFYRSITSPAGISFGDSSFIDYGEYQNWFGEIIKAYVLPMQSRVYPLGTILRDFREVVWKEGDSYLRTLGTCSIRVRVKGMKLKPYNRYDLRVVGNAGYRLLEGELVNQREGR